MRRFIVAAIVAGAATAAYCDPLATVEVFDDPGFVHRTGVMDSPVKTLYVRIQYFPATEGYTGVELSLTGLHDFDSTTLAFATEPVLVLGSVAAPENQDTGQGGINIAWASCQTNSLLFTLTLVSGSPPSNRSIQVARRFPSTNSNYPFPFHTMCDAPCFCIAELGGAPYVLNPTVSAEDVAWSGIKEMYR